ncbi:MAG: hypothetical protein M1827_007400 [Pycnora praestabilis]|nr:MAG: hypothetical protein M1827_007400 [Pycnora praestabilis]
MVTSSPFTLRPRTPSKSSSNENTTTLPPLPEANGKFPRPVRRSSLGFLRRAKSGEPLTNRSLSGSKLIKKQKAFAQQEECLRQQREAAQISRSPPRIPEVPPPPRLNAFGGETLRPDSVDIVSNRVRGHHRGSLIKRGAMDQESPKFVHSIPIPPIPATPPVNKRQGSGDPYARTESMTNRGRYSYASSGVSTINSPRRVRRRKDPTPFNILVIGARNSGKTSFINFLRTSLALPANKRTPSRTTESSSQALASLFSTRDSIAGFTSHYLETESEGERIGLTLWDSHGFSKNAVDLELREIATFIESKFEDTFTEEMKVIRAPGVQDTHIHCVFWVLDPVRLDQNIAAAQRQPNGDSKEDRLASSNAQNPSALDEDLDLQVLRTLQGKTTVVPVISKADTITTAHMSFLKKTVSDSLRRANLDPLEALGLDDSESVDESDDSSNITEENDGEDSPTLPVQMTTGSTMDSTNGTPSSDDYPTTPKPKRRPSTSYKHTSSANPMTASASSTETPPFPLSIISPDMYDPGTIGRKFPWGFADPNNVDHCDFVRLKEAVFKDWRGELREASRELWYERWRTSRLDRGRGR